MDDPNTQTITAYQKGVGQYVENTPHETPDFVAELIDTATANLPKSARILELGSAFGREGAYLESRGYSVECSDAAPAFVKLLAQNGFAARQLNAITDELGGPYDFILANAVLLHFTREQTYKTLSKILAALRPGGILAFTVLEGEGEAFTEFKLGAQRYFCYWSADQILHAVQDAGFTEASVAKFKANPYATWLKVIAHKPSPSKKL